MVLHTWPLILFFAAITDLSASLRWKDIMRSGLGPPVGLASGVICPAVGQLRLQCAQQLGQTSHCFPLESGSHTNVPHACQAVLVH